LLPWSNYESLWKRGCSVMKNKTKRAFLILYIKLSSALRCSSTFFFGAGSCKLDLGGTRAGNEPGLPQCGGVRGAA